MRKWMMLFVVFLFAAGTAMADVSNEVVVGLQADSTSAAKDINGADIKSQIDNKNSLFAVQYTHFFSPLKDDGKPIDLRTFYQHPSNVSVGLAFMGAQEKDKSIPFDTKTNASMLQLGGDLHLPTNTMLFAMIGMGSGTTKDNTGGPDTDLKLGQIELGVRQYIGEAFALQLRLANESMESTVTGFPSQKDEKSVTYLGAKWVIADTVGLSLELGGGKLEQKAGGLTLKQDITALNAEIAGYIGKQFSVRLAVASEEEDMQGMAPGFAHTVTTSRTTLGFRYWFSEGFGLDLPVYAEKTEDKVTAPGGGGTSSVTQSGMGLFASFRF